MGVKRVSIVGCLALALVVGAAMAIPAGAKADLLDGVSLRVGMLRPANNNLQNITDDITPSIGFDWMIPGTGWGPAGLCPSISVDFLYSDFRTQIYRDIRASLNLIKEFDEQNGRKPFGGFCLTAATFGTTGVGSDFTGEGNGSGSLGNQSTVTRIGAGLILGLNLNSKLYIEGRYEWFDKKSGYFNPEGFRGVVGYRF